MSNEYFNQLNIVLYQLWSEISIKQVKHQQIFNGMLDPDGNLKRNDFHTALVKVSIMSEFQFGILLKFYDSLNTETLNG